MTLFGGQVPEIPRSEITLSPEYEILAPDPAPLTLDTHTESLEASEGSRGGSVLVRSNASCSPQSHTRWRCGRAHPPNTEAIELLVAEMGFPKLGSAHRQKLTHQARIPRIRLLVRLFSRGPKRCTTEEPLPGKQCG